MHAHEMYAHDVHGYEVHAEMYAYETHAVLHKLASWRTGTQIIISVVGFWAYAPREFLILGNLGKQMTAIAKTGSVFWSDVWGAVNP